MKYLLFIIGILSSGIMFGQQKEPKLEVFLKECILKGVKGDAYLQTTKNSAHFYTIAFSFSKEGKIDTLYYSSIESRNQEALFT